jgi:hypothetical protein
MELKDSFTFKLFKNNSQMFNISDIYLANQFKLTSFGNLLPNTVEMNCYVQKDINCLKNSMAAISFDIFVSPFTFQIRENIAGVGNNLWTNITDINDRILFYSNQFNSKKISKQFNFIETIVCVK